MLLFDTGKKLEKAFTKEQFDALVEVLEKRDGSLATSQEVNDVKTELKGDIAAVKTELKGDIAVVKGELRETELRLQKEIEVVRKEVQQVKYDLLKWQLGIGFAIILVMAKGFGWLGF